MLRCEIRLRFIFAGDVTANRCHMSEESMGEVDLSLRLADPSQCPFLLPAGSQIPCDSTLREDVIIGLNISAIDRAGS
jgi:hypothetical protein